MANKCVVCSESKCMYPAYDKEEVDKKFEEKLSGAFVGTGNIKIKSIVNGHIADAAITSRNMGSDVITPERSDIISNGAISREKIEGGGTTYVGTYTGTGIEMAIECPFKPKLVLIWGFKNTNHCFTCINEDDYMSHFYDTSSDAMNTEKAGSLGYDSEYASVFVQNGGKWNIIISEDTPYNTIDGVYQYLAIR